MMKRIVLGLGALSIVAAFLLFSCESKSNIGTQPSQDQLSKLPAGEEFTDGGDGIEPPSLTVVVKNGDTDGDGVVYVSDLVRLINFHYRNSGQNPADIWVIGMNADLNCDDTLNVNDVERFVAWANFTGNILNPDSNAVPCTFPLAKIRAGISSELKAALGPENVAKLEELLSGG